MVYDSFEQKEVYTRGISRKESDGVIFHSDDNGNHTGTSRPTLGGRYVDYDRDGNVVGHTSEFGGSLVHYDKDGNITGRSIKGLSKNAYYHTDNSPHIVDGCYVATCVYGSYDCPQVWALRRFRDNTLKCTPFGRAFIRTYYAVSPSLVRRFGNCRWFQTMWRGILDRMVAALRKKGVKDTPYKDPSEK